MSSINSYSSVTPPHSCADTASTVSSTTSSAAIPRLSDDRIKEIRENAISHLVQQQHMSRKAAEELIDALT